MAVSKTDLSLTRVQARTRRAILDAAAALVRDGGSPTVAEAAERAQVSRATAYRYFPTQLSMLIELRADASRPSPEQVMAEAGGDAADRVETATRAITRMVLADEALYRTQARVAQELWLQPGRDPDVPIREGRRLVFIDAALEPLRGTMAPATLDRLRTGLAVVLGVDAVLSLRDVCRLDGRAIEDALAWTARALVDAARSPTSAGGNEPGADGGSG